MTTEIVQHGYGDIEKMGRAIVASGLFGIKTHEQAIALMLIAQAEGLHPAIAALDYNIIQNRPALTADAILGRFQAKGGRVEWGDYTDQRVVGTFSHPQGGSVTIEWTMERASRAGLAGKDNWKKWPRQMLRSRCISEGVRTVAPGTTVGRYPPDEVEDFEAPPPPGRRRVQNTAQQTDAGPTPAQDGAEAPAPAPGNPKVAAAQAAMAARRAREQAAAPAEPTPAAAVHPTTVPDHLTALVGELYDLAAEKDEAWAQSHEPLDVWNVLCRRAGDKPVTADFIRAQIGAARSEAGAAPAAGSPSAKNVAERTNALLDIVIESAGCKMADGLRGLDRWLTSQGIVEAALADDETYNAALAKARATTRGGWHVWIKSSATKETQP